MNFFLPGKRQREYSVERLRGMYGDLLEAIQPLSNPMTQTSVLAAPNHKFRHDQTPHKQIPSHHLNGSIPNDENSDSASRDDSNTSEMDQSVVEGTAMESHSLDRRQWESERGSPRRLRRRLVPLLSGNPAAVGLGGLSRRRAAHEQRRQHMAWLQVQAFRTLAATRSAEKEGREGPPVAAWRDANAVAVLQAARAKEQHVVKLIRGIGVVILNAEGQPEQRQSNSNHGPVWGASPMNAIGSQLRSDEVFEYFCEKAILSLLVDMVLDKPMSTPAEADRSQNVKTPPHFHGVVWTAAVKAEILHTVSLLVSSMRETSALYYVLSQNCINQLVLSIRPLQQWTDPALEVLLPPYVEMLKNLALLLSDSPHLFPFFTVQEKDRTFFPLFSATLETGTSSYAQSNSFVHATCLNLIVDLMQILDGPIREWVFHESLQEQVFLAKHMGELLLRRYRRLVNLTTGPVVDGVRYNSIEGQWQGLNDQIDVLNDIFACGIRGLNLRLCELLLVRVVSTLLLDLAPSTGTTLAYNSTSSSVSMGGTAVRLHFLPGAGVPDADVIPEREARAQVSSLFLGRLLERLRFPPLVRMLAVAIFHPKSTPKWQAKEGLIQRQWVKLGNPPSSHVHDDDDNDDDAQDQFCFTPILNKIALGKTDEEETIHNPYRYEILQALSGAYGDWRTVGVAILVEHAIRSSILDGKTLELLHVIPSFRNSEKGSETETSPVAGVEEQAEFRSGDGDEGVPDLEPEESQERSSDMSVEHALCDFLLRHHVRQSTINSIALECISSVTMHFIHQTCAALIQSGQTEALDQVWSSELLQAVAKARSYFFRQAMESQTAMEVADIFVDLMEAAVLSRYRRVTVTKPGFRTGPRIFAYQLSRYGCSVHATKSGCLVRKIRSVSSNVLEETRFYAEMALHFRAVSGVLDKFKADLRPVTPRGTNTATSPMQNGQQVPKLDLLDRAGELESIFGGLRAKPAVGTDIDLHGRMAFHFTSNGMMEEHVSSDLADQQPSSRVRSLSDDMIFRSESQLVLVLDPTDMFVVKPTARLETVRGTVICCIPLLNVIAAAVDGDWLHIAVRHENVGFLIKNGNMALKFDTPGTGHIVRQYLDRSCQVLRRELISKIKDLLHVHCESNTQQ